MFMETIVAIFILFTFVLLYVVAEVLVRNFSKPDNKYDGVDDE